MRATQIKEFQETIAEGGLAIFPTDTVYGLGTHPDSVEGVHRLYWVKGRSPDQASAVLFFSIDLALSSLPELGPKTREAVERLLPGPVTVLVPNPATRFPLACGTEPDRLGIRVPALADEMAALVDVTVPILQSSANPSGEADPRSLEDVDPRIRKGADIEIDAGELPGTPSTVVDLSRYEASGEHEVLREGALTQAEIADRL